MLTVYAISLLERTQRVDITKFPFRNSQECLQVGWGWGQNAKMADMTMIIASPILCTCSIEAYTKSWALIMQLCPPVWLFDHSFPMPLWLVLTEQTLFPWLILYSLINFFLILMYVCIILPKIASVASNCWTEYRTEARKIHSLPL